MIFLTTKLHKITMLPPIAWLKANMNPKTSIRAPKFEAMAPSSMSPGSPFGAQLKQRPETRVSGVETCRQAVATNRSMCACRFQALENNESGSLKHMEKSDRHSHEIYRCTKNYTRYIYICIDMPLIHLDVFCFESLMDRQDFVFLKIGQKTWQAPCLPMPEAMEGFHGGAYEWPKSLAILLYKRGL